MERGDECLFALGVHLAACQVEIVFGGDEPQGGLAVFVCEPPWDWPGLERPHAATQRGHVDHGLALFEKGRAEGGVLGPRNRPVHSEPTFERAGDVDDVLALHDFDVAGEGLLGERQSGLENERAHRAGILRGDHLHDLLGRFAVKGHAGRALLLRGRAEAVQREKVSHRGQRTERLSVEQQQFG